MFICGHGLVVEHVLAKDETGVRFSLAAHSQKYPDICDIGVFLHQKETRLIPRDSLSTNKTKLGITLCICV